MLAQPHVAEATLDVHASIVRRMARLAELEHNLAAQRVEMELCRRSVQHWFHWWVWTFDPRVVVRNGSPAFMPFDLFPRQIEMLTFFDERIRNTEDGLVEKIRDIGFTWEAGGFALHKWLFVPGFKTTFGSRKEEYVDKKGEPDSIFEKIRMMRRTLPKWMQPPAFNFTCDNFMRLVNPYNGNTIKGEAGDQMGRGGRSTWYVIDEAAYIEHGDSVDAATGGNADSRLWASTVRGMSNIFARKRHGGALTPEQIFIFDIKDDPRKTPEWIAKKKRTLEPHVWASEYGRDYTASVEGIAIPAGWVQAAINLRAELERRGLPQPEPATTGIGGLDVGAGKAKSVFVARFGPVVLPPTAWGDPDTIETANRALDCAAEIHLQRQDGFDCRVRVLNYDAPGVGRGVLDALAHHEKSELATYGINTGATPSDTKWPDEMTSVEKFVNLKAELWWKLRSRFKCSHELMLFLHGERGGENHALSDCIFLPPLSAGPDVQILVAQISMVKWFRNEKGKIIMESKSQLSTREIPSPDHADALALTEASSHDLSEWENL